MTKYSLLEKIMLALSLIWLVVCFVQIYRLVRSWTFCFRLSYVPKGGTERMFVWPKSSTGKEIDDADHTDR